MRVVLLISKVWKGGTHSTCLQSEMIFIGLGSREWDLLNWTTLKTLFFLVMVILLKFHGIWVFAWRWKLIVKVMMFSDCTTEEWLWSIDGCILDHNGRWSNCGRSVMRNNWKLLLLVLIIEDLLLFWHFPIRTSINYYNLAVFITLTVFVNLRTNFFFSQFHFVSSNSINSCYFFCKWNWPLKFRKNDFLLFENS